MSWRRREHCLGVLWQLSIGKVLLHYKPHCCLVHSYGSARFPHSFRFPSASSSRHLSSFLCQTVPIWNRLPSFVISSTSLSSFRSEVRRYFVSDMFTYVHLWSLLVIFSHSFRRLPHFICIFVFMFQHLFCSLFFCVCVVISFPRGKAAD